MGVLRMAMKPQARRLPKPKSIDEYLARLPSDQRAALQRLRKIVHATVPRAEEGISYQIPAFRIDGRWLVYMGAGTNHCALYGMREADPGDLEGFDTSGKGTIRFQPDHPLPAALVRMLFWARFARHRRPA